MFWYYALQFVIGGGIIVGMSFLAKNVTPKAAALLYALPIQFTIALIFIGLGTNKETVTDLAQNGIYAVMALLVFLALFYLLSKKLDVWTSLAISYCFLIGGLLLLLRI